MIRPAVYLHSAELRVSDAISNLHALDDSPRIVEVYRLLRRARALLGDEYEAACAEHANAPRDLADEAVTDRGGALGEVVRDG